MSQGETLISIILIVIAYLLYQIVKQLSYLTGRKIKSPFTGWGPRKHSETHHKPKEKEEKLPN